MRRKICCLIVACLFLLGSIGVRAAALPLLFDQAGLLSTNEAQEVRESLDEVSRKYSCDVVVATADKLDGMSPTEYADWLYENSGYGQGEDSNGILLLVSLDDRDWAISTSGDARAVFNDDAQEYMMSKVRPCFSEGKYAQGFLEYAKISGSLLADAEAGVYYGVNQEKTDPEPESKGLPFGWLFGDLGIGAVIAGLLGKSKASKLHGIRRQSSADAYLKAEDIRFDIKEDRYVRTDTERRKIEKNEERPEGMATTHMSSGGHSHGGSSGKF